MKLIKLLEQVNKKSLVQEFNDWCIEKKYGWAELKRIDKLSPSVIEDFLINQNKPHSEKEVRECKEKILIAWKQK